MLDSDSDSIHAWQTGIDNESGNANANHQSTERWMVRVCVQEQRDIKDNRIFISQQFTLRDWREWMGPSVDVIMSLCFCVFEFECVIYFETYEWVQNRSENTERNKTKRNEAKRKKMSKSKCFLDCIKYDNTNSKIELSVHASCSWHFSIYDFIAALRCGRKCVISSELHTKTRQTQFTHREYTEENSWFDKVKMKTNVFFLHWNVNSQIAHRQTDRHNTNKCHRCVDLNAILIFLSAECCCCG